MQAMLFEYYLIIKSLHIIAVISWMAGLLYLPRLFAYHAAAENGSDMSVTFKVMEQRLLRIIMNPAMITAWLFGLLMLYANPALFESGWIHVKLFLIVVMTALHHLFARWCKMFGRDENTRSVKFYKIWNEAPTVLMIVIVFLAIMKPF